jgi:hypothetical protein
MATPARRRRIAQRIAALLARTLDAPVDVQRLLDDARYARDVLLVCDAHPGSDAASLAMHFRAETRALALEAPEPLAPPAAGEERFVRSLRRVAPAPAGAGFGRLLGAWWPQRRGGLAGDARA